MERLKTDNQWRGIRKFMLICSAFLAIAIVLIAAGEIAIRRFVPNPYRFKHERLARKSSDISTLVLGSSLGFYGIRPEFLGDSAFNLANVAQNFHYDNLLLRHYEFPNLKTVILPVSYDSFTEMPLDDNLLNNTASNYKIYMDINDHEDWSPFNFEISNFPVYSQKLLSLFQKRPLSYDSLGFGVLYNKNGRIINWFKSGPYTAETQTDTTFRMKDYNLRELSEIVSFCKENEIRLIMIMPPFWESYRNSMARSQYDLTVRLADSVARASGFRFINMVDDKRFDSEDFYDANHLNSDGAAKLSKILRDSLNHWR